MPGAAKGLVWKAEGKPQGSILDLFHPRKSVHPRFRGSGSGSGVAFQVPHATGPQVIPLSSTEAFSFLETPWIPPCGPTRWRCAQRQPQALPGGQRDPVSLWPALGAGSPIHLSGLGRSGTVWWKKKPGCTHSVHRLSHQAHLDSDTPSCPHRPQILLTLTSCRNMFGRARTGLRGHRFWSLLDTASTEAHTGTSVHEHTRRAVS